MQTQVEKVRKYDERLMPDEQLKLEEMLVHRLREKGLTKRRNLNLLLYEKVKTMLPKARSYIKGIHIIDSDTKILITHTGLTRRMIAYIKIELQQSPVFNKYEMIFKETKKRRLARNSHRAKYRRWQIEAGKKFQI